MAAFLLRLQVEIVVIETATDLDVYGNTWKLQIYY